MPLSRRVRPLAALALAVLLAPAIAPAQEPDSGAYLAARTAATNNDYLAAARWQEEALLADPGNRKLLEATVITEIALGRFQKAAEASRRLEAAGTSFPIASLALLAEAAAAEDYAAILGAAGEGQSAGRLLDELLGAWSELGLGRMSEALAAFDATAATPGTEAFGLYHKALALASAGDFEGADAILSGTASGPINLNRRGIIAHAQILSQLERNDDALARLDTAFGPDADPGVDALRSDLRAGKVLAFDIAPTPKAGIAEVFFTMATALNGEADDGFTLLYARTAAYLNPQHSEAVLLSAGLLEQLDQFDLARETYALIRPEDPAYHAAEIGRAGATLAAGDLDGAVAILTGLAQTHGDIFTVHLALADMLRRNERFAEALVAYDATLALIPDPRREHWSIFFSRGISQERLGNFDAAAADMRRALEFQPDQPQVLNYLGYSYVDRGENLDEALEMIERAVAAQPDAGYIIDSLAWAYYRLGRYAEALEPMERASILEPVDPIVTDHLGDVYWMNGRQREARFQWHRALSFDPEEKDAIRIRRKLEVGLDVVREEEAAADPAADPAPADGN